MYIATIRIADIQWWFFISGIAGFYNQTHLWGLMNQERRHPCILTMELLGRVRNFGTSTPSKLMHIHSLYCGSVGNKSVAPVPHSSNWSPHPSKPSTSLFETCIDVDVHAANTLASFGTTKSLRSLRQQNHTNTFCISIEAPRAFSWRG